ncbi:DoxX family membrane protein [Azoarcus sp. TTM-91]|uniref:DoxX family protein n=1 Tax=Azoarcus sp. TTM-91 TaxID=2691581 RepID=UPI00145F700C|nr:DoxX family protein [Azoarcus sp. TTM-91]NMG36021.1 DoxX family membrane protein [Azoarcus sp. TTM-91]
MSANKNRFDLADPLVVLRLALGLLYVPHVYYKLAGFEGSLGFFTRAGFHPALFFLVLSLALETACAVGLTFGILVKWVGLLSGGLMAVAAYATIVVKGPGWLWNLGGVEYLVLWGLLSVTLALHAWREERREYGRYTLFFPHAA